MPTPAQHPFHPIIYVRGFAATQGEIEDTVADPYMGFNIGSSKSRTAWTGDVRRFYLRVAAGASDERPPVRRRVSSTARTWCWHRASRPADPVPLQRDHLPLLR
jgi:hypothetical protein